MKFPLIGLLWICLSTALWAAPGLDIEAKLEQAQDPLPFGKTATLVLSLSWDEKWPFTPPPADKLELEGFTVVDHFTTSVITSPGSGRQGLKYNIVFTRFEPGSATIPSLDFETPSGVVKSPSLTINYKGAEAKADDKPDQLRGPKEAVALSSRDFWLWLAKVVGLALLGLLLLAAIVRKLGLLERWLSPRSRALRQLGRLARALDQNAVEAPAVLLDMVEIVRVYLDRTYGLVTREATSREIAAQLTMSNRCQNIKPIAKAVLERGDVTKFAQRDLSSHEARDLLEQLRAALAAEKRKP